MQELPDLTTSLYWDKLRLLALFCGWVHWFSARQAGFQPLCICDYNADSVTLRFPGMLHTKCSCSARPYEWLSRKQYQIIIIRLNLLPKSFSTRPNE